jgi:drug/metabolite transporter (DMT)-like permease
MAVLVGLLVAASFGSGDFLGGLASRRDNTLTVLAWAQLAALGGALIIALIWGGPLTANAVLLGAGAGLLNMMALGCLFQGLAIGQIGQVAPAAAVIGAVLPVAWGLAIGERPPALALAGVGLAVLAGALISAEKDEQRAEGARIALLLAVLAGIGFGTSFILFADSSHHPGFWPVLSARVAAVVGVWLIVLISGAPRTLAAPSRRLAASAGFLDVAATTLLIVAVRTGLTAVVAPVASLAPGFTVMHAWWYLHEKVSRLQTVGLGIALVGLSLIAIS